MDTFHLAVLCKWEPDEWKQDGEKTDRTTRDEEGGRERNIKEDIICSFLAF